MEVRINIDGPQGCGKTVLGNKIAKLIKEEAPPGTHTVIRCDNGVDRGGGSDHRDRHKEHDFDV